jgi:uncharacterized membrane protein (Fun14 family)
MSFEEYQFIVLTALTGCVTGFLAAYLGIKISKLLILVGIILVIAQYLFVNEIFEISWIDITEIFEEKIDEYDDEITSLGELLIKNIPLTIGIIAGILFGVKKGL